MDQAEVVYEAGDGLTLNVRTDGETVWLTQFQMSQLFDRDVSVVSRHVANVFKEGELPKDSNLHFLQIANSTKRVAFYSLDVVISVGYRVKSVRGTRFRQWATRMLREMLLHRLDEVKRICKLETRMSEAEIDIDQVKGTVDYLFRQLEDEGEKPRRRIGFGASEETGNIKPYGKLV